MNGHIFPADSPNARTVPLSKAETYTKPPPRHFSFSLWHILLLMLHNCTPDHFFCNVKRIFAIRNPHSLRSSTPINCFAVYPVNLQD